MRGLQGAWNERETIDRYSEWVGAQSAAQPTVAFGGHSVSNEGFMHQHGLYVQGDDDDMLP